MRRETLARRNLHHVTIVRGARGVVVEEDGIAAAARPRLQRNRPQVAHIERRNDFESFGLYPTRVGRLLLGLELAGEFFGNERSFFGGLSHWAFPFLLSGHPILAKTRGKG